MTTPSHELRGIRQTEVMRIMWRFDEATVDDVRAAQPPSRRAAYTTIATVMDRLLDRGLLERRRRGKAFVYRARFAESELVARSISELLAAASPDARTPALLTLMTELGQEELAELARYANKLRREAQKR